MHCDERRNRRLRELEIASIARALNESQAQQREESRAARRKYREERKARINQLFAPVRMILSKEHFVRADTVEEATIPLNMVGKSDATIDGSETSQKSCESLEEPVETNPCQSCCDSTKGDGEEIFDSEDFVLVPKPGLPHGAGMYEYSKDGTTCILANNQTTKDDVEVRKIPNECSICLCEYTVGSDIVWSSNPKCDHVFHTACIEEWLMKQRDGPRCPCCRRDFVIDPLDGERGEDDDLEKGNLSSRRSDSRRSASSQSRELTPAERDAEVEEAFIAMLFAMARLEDSDGSDSDLPV